MNNFIKGLIAGIFNITPGLSGSIFLIIVNLYDKCIYEINNIFKKPKESIIFLTPIGLGITLGILLSSKIVYILINNYSKETFIIFTGFILGTIPHLIKKSTKEKFKKSYLIPFFISLTIGTLMLFIKPNKINYNIDYNILFSFKYILIGVLLSISTIIPGISSTILLSIFNFYGIYIYSISNVIPKILIWILIGYIITTIILSKIINYLLTNYYSYTYFFILGFTIGTLPTLINLNIELNINTIISVILSILCFKLTIKILSSQ